MPAKHNENAAHWKSVVNFVDWCVNKVEVEVVERLMREVERRPRPAGDFLKRCVKDL